MAADKTHAAISAEVARILREERMNCGLSLNMLAARAGLSRQMVSYVEREERNPSLETLLRVAEVLEVPLDQIIRRARLAAAKRIPAAHGHDVIARQGKASLAFGEREDERPANTSPRG